MISVECGDVTLTYGGLGECVRGGECAGGTSLVGLCFNFAISYQDI